MTKTMTTAFRDATDETLRNALRHADPMALMGLVYHAIGDERLADIATMTVQAGFGQANIVTDATQAERVQDHAFELLKAYRDGAASPPLSADNGRLLRAMSLAAGEPVPEEELPLYSDILSFDDTPRGWGATPQGDVAAFNVIVIGAGLAGINAAVQLKASGIDFVVLDKNAGPGGTWHNNRYPGARVDWPSRLYSHSFGVDFPFTHPFAPRAENEAYMQWCVERFSLRPHMAYSCEVLECVWEESSGRWRLRVRDEDGRESERSARAIISATGLLERPSIPQFMGMERFEGTIFHSSRFDDAIDLGGKRVGVVGTGASGLQMTPDLAPLVKHLTVFQRSPGWLIPAPGYREPLPQGAQWLDANVPFYTNWTRFVLGWVLGDHKLFKVFEVDPDWTDPNSANAENHEVRERLLAHLHAKLAGHPELVDKCTPDYPVFGNRPVMDNGWFDALLRDDVSLVTSGIERFTKDGIVTTDGVEHPLDIVVMATGFGANQYFAPMQIVGRDGVTVDQVWEKDGPRAYWGITVPQLPNFFILYGPNANPRNLGPVQYGEWAMGYILQAFRLLIENGWRSIEIDRPPFDAFNADLDRESMKLVSVNPHTRHRSYYTNDFGRSAVQSPWASSQVWRAFSNVVLLDYRVEDQRGNIVDTSEPTLQHAL